MLKRKELKELLRMLYKLQEELPEYSCNYVIVKRDDEYCMTTDNHKEVYLNAEDFLLSNKVAETVEVVKMLIELEK